MDLTKVDSYLEGVEERHEEAECKLTSVREGVRDAEGWTEGPSGASGSRAAQAERILGKVRGALEEAWCMIECIREELDEEPHGDLYEEEELDLVRSRLLETELRHEELESEYDSLNTILGIESDSDGHELPDAFGFGEAHGDKG